MLNKVRRPNDHEFELASKFAQEEGSGVASIGVNRFNGSINIELDNGRQFILDKKGNPTHERKIVYPWDLQEKMKEKSNIQKLIDAGYSENDAEDFADEFEQGGVKVPPKVKKILSKQPSSKMKKSEFKAYIKEEIIDILSEISAEDIEDKAEAQSEFNKELEKTKELKGEMDETQNINEATPYDKITGNVISYLYYMVEFVKKNEPQFLPTIQKIYDAYMKFDEKMAYGDPPDDNTSDFKRAGQDAGFDMRGINEGYKFVKNKKITRVGDILSALKQSPQKTPNMLLTVAIDGAPVKGPFYITLIGGVLAIHNQPFPEDQSPSHPGTLSEEDDEEEPTTAQIKKGDSVSKIGLKLGEVNDEMKTIVKKWKNAEEPEKTKLLTRLKSLTKMKKELEALL